MKISKAIILLILMFFTSFLNNAVSSEKLNFNTEVIQTADNRIDVVVKIVSGEPDFIYSIWINEPWENGKEIDNSGKIISSEYTFRNLKVKPYFIMVTDKNGLKRIKQIQVTDQ